MKISRFHASIFNGLLLATALLAGELALTAQVAAANDPPSYEDARKAAWILTSELIPMVETGDAKHSQGARAWVKDFRDATKGISKDAPLAKWPKVDIDALVDHNPNFWQMYYEIAPADPVLTLIHAGLLLSQGEARRAAYILELGKHRPGIPAEARQAIDAMQATADAALRATNELTKEGTELFDRGEYQKAAEKYRAALKLCPQNGWTSYELGYTLRTQAQIARGEALGKPGTV